MNAQHAPHADFTFPASYRLGCGRIAELPKICDELEVFRPLIVTDPGVAVLPWFDSLPTHLNTARRTSFVYSGVHENPIEEDVIGGVSIYRAENCDGVILIGGGSALDVGKCVALLARNPGSTFDYEDIGDNYKRADPQKIPPMVAIPTTSGTGSEVGRASVIINERHEKKIIFHPNMQPPVVLADPELTFGLPPHLTAFTGLDAFVHCFEAYCAPSYHPMADGIALEGMRLICEALPRAFQHGRDALARTHMMMASSMGATAFQKGLGIVHAIAHALGGRLRIHHGMANAILLPYCMLFNRNVIEERCSTVARHLRLRRDDFTGLLDWVLEIRRALDVPHTLAELETFSDDLTALLAPTAYVDPALTSNPKSASISDLEELISHAAHGKL